MFIHLGMNQMIRVQELVAIISVQNQRHPDLLKQVEVKKKEEIKSIVFTKDRVYASPISALTLMKRAQQSQDFE